jgi:hypothetical protein
MSPEESVERVNRKSLQFYGLTRDQCADCYKAGRSPKTGKRFRTSPPTPLEQACKKINWAKLTVKGASIAMRKAVDLMVLRPAEADDLNKTIRKLETLLLDKLTEGYEVKRFEYWQEQASSKK